jgi:hypothetical protein
MRNRALKKAWEFGALSCLANRGFDSVFMMKIPSPSRPEFIRAWQDGYAYTWSRRWFYGYKHSQVMKAAAILRWYLNTYNKIDVLFKKTIMLIKKTLHVSHR